MSLKSADREDVYRLDFTHLDSEI